MAEQPITVTTRGIGKPDYTREISLGQMRSGISLKFNQQLVLFGILFTNSVPFPYPITWVRPQLAIGANAHLYAQDTGIVMPYNIPAGYALTMVQKDWNSSEDCEQFLYFDGLLVAIPGITESGSDVYSNPVYTYSTLTLDPTAALPHTIDIVVLNRGGGALEGAFAYAAILEAIGTPPFPDNKETICPFCNNKQIEPVITTIVTCHSCGRKYYVYDTTRLGRGKKKYN
jgi:hypothetical protein